jgi:hypothetical protein
MKLNSVLIDSKNIMLVTDVVLSATGFPLTIVETHFVEDNTTPASLSPGESSAVPPFLLNLVKPVVAVLPPTGAYSMSTSSPALMVFTFRLDSMFPLRWKLTKLNKQVPSDVQDFTGNAMVNPKDGEWGSSSVSIQLALTGAYMGGLTLGEHLFVMTGIDQRGNAASVTATLTISG